jgi:competence protein ComEC
MRSVAIAATIIMLHTPEAIMFPSFQMSFGAVIAIISLYESEFRLPAFMSLLSGVIVTTIVASIPTSIITVFVFNQLTLNSILANIISILLMGLFIMPVSVIVLLLMPFDVAKPAIMMMGSGIDLLAKVAEETAKLPGSFFVMHTPTNVVFGTAVISGLLFMLIRHKIRFLGLFGMLAAIVGYFHQSTPDIFVSPNAKVVGIRANDTICFNHLGYFRSMTEAWTRSVGFPMRNSYRSGACQKYISKISDETYVANVKNKKIVVTEDDEYENIGDEFAVFHLNGGKNNYSELIYLDSNKRLSNKDICRPWS